MNFLILNLINQSRKIIFAALVLFVILGNFHFVDAVTITPRLELNADPGTTLREEFKVTNEERQSKTFYLSFENFQSVDETGNPSFTGGLRDLATWIVAPSSVVLGPGESQIIPISIVVPKNADAGGHFAAIFLQTQPEEPSRQEVAVSAKLGALILLRVSGDFAQGGDILEFATEHQQRFFNQLPVSFYYRFQNTGDDHIKPLGDIQITNTFGATTKLLSANPVDGSVLPKSIRRFETVWATSGGLLKQPYPVPVLDEPRGFFGQAVYQFKHFAFGKYTAKLKIAYGTPELKSVNASYNFFIFPWQLLVFVTLLLMIFIICFRIFIRRYNKYIINQARRMKH